jgi:hypothetical protein
VSADLSKKAWLAHLVDEELSGYDPVAARLRLPPEIREAYPDGPSLEARARLLVVRSLRLSRFAAGPEEETSAFLSPIQDHIALILDLALLQGGAFEASRRRAELAGFFAAAAGEVELARAALPRGETLPAAAAKKAFARAGAALQARCLPPGDPLLGIPLYAGTLVVMRRLLARIAMSFYRKGVFDRSSVSDYIAYASQELACLTEALVVFATADGPLDAQRRSIIQRQISRLGLARELTRELQRRVPRPRSEAEIARGAPPRMRPFLVEQLLLASVGVEASPAREQVIARFAEAAQLGPDQVVAMKVEAAAFHADHAQLFRAFGLPEPEWVTLASEWELMGDHMVERISAVLSDNLEAIVTEIKQTGELGQLLAKATAGKALTPDEKRKVKEQLIDLARAVPALAIFAAPGGMLLLPLLAKLLPFQLLPSAFQSQAKKRASAAEKKPERS